MLTAEHVLAGLAQALNHWTWDPDDAENVSEEIATRVVSTALICVHDRTRPNDESAEAWRQRIADHALELLAVVEHFRDTLRGDDQSDTEVFACVNGLLNRIYGGDEE